MKQYGRSAIEEEQEKKREELEHYLKKDGDTKSLAQF